MAYIWSTYIHTGSIPGTQDFLFCSSAYQKLNIVLRTVDNSLCRIYY